MALLKPSEVKSLKSLVSRGTAKARVIRRANILLLLQRGHTIENVADLASAGSATVKRTKRAYREGGLDEALYDSHRTGRPRVYGDRVKKKLIALACSDPPDGHARWTLSLLVEHCGLDPAPSRDKVRLLLKEDGLKPWREKNVVRRRVGRRLPRRDE